MIARRRYGTGTDEGPDEIASPVGGGRRAARPQEKAWDIVAHDFHERVRAACWDSLAGRLALLHRPHIDDRGQPVCAGCDRERSERGGSDPAWPCRTYTILAATVLGICDVEGALNAMLVMHCPAALMAAPADHCGGFGTGSTSC